MNQDDQLDQQVEKLLNDVKLKQPNSEQMTDYLVGVRSKIELRQKQFSFHFVPFGIILVSVAAVGLIVFVLSTQPKKESQPIPAIPEVSKSAVSSALDRQNLTLEDEMAILEAFSEEYPAETTDVLGDDGVLEDLVFIDEVEFNATPVTSQGASFNS